jgi:hypothetical protein
MYSGAEGQIMPELLLTVLLQEVDIAASICLGYPVGLVRIRWLLSLLRLVQCRPKLKVDGGV